MLTRRLRKKFAQNLERVAKTVAKLKKAQSIIIKAQYESPKHLHKPSSKLFKYLKQTTFPPKNTPGPFNDGPNDEISPNLVTLTKTLGKKQIMMTISDWFNSRFYVIS